MIIGIQPSHKNKTSLKRAGLIRERFQVPILSTYGRNNIIYIAQNRPAHIDGTFRAKIGDGTEFLKWIAEHAPEAYFGKQVQNPGWEFTFIVVEKQNEALAFKMRWG